MTDEIYLAHHGILGQRWGVRRYQNPDGSLTAEGRKKLGYSSETVKGKNKNNNNNPVNTISNKTKESLEAGERLISKRKRREADKTKKDMDLSKMTDEELRSKINRMDLERRYKDLATADITHGEERVERILSDAKDVVVIAGGIATIATALYKASQLLPASPKSRYITLK